MKIIALGGAGDMGSEAVRDLVKNEEVEEVIIADYDLKKAQELSSKLGEKTEALFVDANNHNNLVEVISGKDVALSCIGPFYKFEEKVARAAIEAKVNYISICDDFDATEAVLKLDEEAKKRGVTVLTGVGWTPGMSNVLARKGANELDKVEEINIAWAGDCADSEGLAVIKHTLHIYTGKIKTYREGKYLEIPAASGKEMVEFPEPIGRIPVYHLGHPEPVTIPYFMKGIRTVTLKGGLTPVWVNGVTKLFVRLGLTNTVEKRDKYAQLIKDRLIRYMMKGAKKFSGLRVDVKGEKEGKKTHLTFKAVDHMNRLTGIPLAIGAIILGKGEIEQKGVIAPEACIDPDKFIKELERREIRVIKE